MPITYGALRCKCVSKPCLKSSRKRHEIQYHLHGSFSFEGNGSPWDCAINVGTDDSDDLLQYKLLYDFDHGVLDTLRQWPRDSGI